MYPQVFGKYVLERELSRGGMARVLLATLRGAGGFEKRLVVKQIRDELSFDNQFVRRFVEEAKTTVALSHPNIVPVYELGVEQGTYFLAMELVEGLSVAELLRERNADGSRRVLTPEEGAYIGIEVCRALDYAHRRMKVVHRDITPRNVMIDEEGQIKLIDFGIAAPALVAGHEIFGSPGHMPPEQVDGAELGPPTDIFAVAVLLMEAWTGSAPFRRGTPEECDEAMRGPHPRPSDFEPRLLPLDDAIMRAMRLAPRERQQEASELARALRNFLRDVDTADIARELGIRVQDAREAASSPAPPPETGGGARPAQPSAGELGTKTFAARDEALHWSNPPPPLAFGGDGSPSTRKLDGISPLAPLELTRDDVAWAKRRTSSRPPRGRADDPAMAIPTPLMVEPVGTLEEAVLAASAKKAESKKPDSSKRPDSSRSGRLPEGGSRSGSSRSRLSRSADDLETIATRPLETPVRPIEPQPVPSPSSRSRILTAGIFLALVAVGGIVAWRARANDAKSIAASTPSSVASTTAPSPTTPPSANPTPSSSVAEPVPTRQPVDAPPKSHESGAAATRPAPPSASAPVAGRALVQLLGDPGTKVSIDGATRVAVPRSVTLEPGQHEASFSFEPTGEGRTERFSVKAGDRVTVRADFAGASPTVRIQRAGH